MSIMPAFDLLTIGHSNLPEERFAAMLQAAGMRTLADVRSVPASRYCPWFSKRHLSARLAQAGIDYVAMGDALGGRPRHASLYCDGVADYEAMAAVSEFRAGLDQVQTLTARARVSLMCAEREPLDCHRCLLVARALAARDLTIGHILHDGTIEPHAATEQRLLALAGASCDLFAPGQEERLAAAYRARSRAVAFRQKPETSAAERR